MTSKERDVIARALMDAFDAGRKIAEVYPNASTAKITWERASVRDELLAEIDTIEVKNPVV